MKRVLSSMALVTVLAALALMVGCDQHPNAPVVGMKALSAYRIWTVNGAQSSCADLLAGRNIEAGSVCFEIVGDNLLVTFTTIGGWQFEEAHLWVGCDPTGYPMTRSGNPKIGNFPYHSGDITGETTYTFPVDLTQFNCLDPSKCDPGNFMYAMAHAALRKVDGSGNVIQTETGWGDGDPTGGKSWATVVTLELRDENCGGNPGNKCFDEETAFAFDGDQSGCFQNYPDYLDNPNRWGWTNGPYGSGEYTWNVYAGAGQCDLTKGTLVGTATLVYDGSTATVTYNLTGGWILATTHVYVGCEEFARNNQGEFTLAPGQYGSTNTFDPADGSTTSTHTITGLNGCDVYAVIHAAVLKEKVCVD